MTTLSETTEILRDLIAFPTVSTDSNLACIGYLADRLERAGARVEVYQDDTGAKANLWATLGPDTDGGIVLSGHSDVVPVTDQDWTSDPFVMDERAGLLYGRGACDMKGFIAAAVAMAPLYAARDLARPIHFAFTHDEETGCLGGQALVTELQNRGYRPAMAIIGEPTEMRIIEGHKGCFEYSTHFHGLEGHGSGPDLGVNAVEYAVRYVSRLLELKDKLRHRCPPDSQFEPPWTTINTGALIGGVAHNVIPGKARVDWEMRPVQKSDADFVKQDLHHFCTHHLLPAMQAVDPSASIHTEVIGEVVGLEPMDQNAIRDLVVELTGANATDLVPFGTEAGLFQQLGMDVIVCGPGSIAQAHKPDEFVSLDQMVQCLSMLEKLGDKVSA
ncbi:acetylornithine deacetylase [Marivivens marinus]|uniref:acetylornithine deacetylase n=1 Tax=Marivivens marinus TaxID=3110173 RepID=UPI003B847139